MHTTLRAFARFGLLAAIGLGMAVLWALVTVVLFASDARASDRTDDGLLSGVTKTIEKIGEPVVDDAVKPTVEKVVAPTVEKITRPVTEKVTKPAAEIVKKVTKPVADKVTEPVTDKVVPPTAEVVEKVTKPVTEKVTKPVADTVVKPVTDKVITPIAETVAPIVAPVTDKVVEPVTDAVVRPVTDAVTPVTDALVEPVVEAVAPVTDAVVTPVAEAVLPPVVDAVRPVTDPVVDAVSPVIPPVAGVTDPVVDAVTPELPNLPVQVPGSPTLPVAPIPSEVGGSDELAPSEPAIDVETGAVPTRTSTVLDEVGGITPASVVALFSAAVAQTPADDAAAVAQHPLVLTDPAVPAPSAPASESGSLTSTSTGGAAGLFALLPFGLPVAHRAWARRGRPTDEQGLPAPFFDTDVSPD